MIMNDVQIIVFRPLPTGNKEIYRNVVKMPVGVSFPFDNFVECLKWLYPSCVIQFSVLL